MIRVEGPEVQEGFGALSFRLRGFRVRSSEWLSV